MPGVRFSRCLADNMNKSLGRWELLAIGLGGMVGGGIFSIMGVAVANIGNLTPMAIALGGCLAWIAAYSYVQLAKHYADEGATYSFFKRSYPDSEIASSAVGWIVTFGYVSTLALYAYTFGAYFTSLFPFENPVLAEKVAAGGILLLFAGVNLLSVKGMGVLEDWMVYTKLVLLALIALVLLRSGSIQELTPLRMEEATMPLFLMTAAITFVAFEGFQLIIHATDDAKDPQITIPWAIYRAVFAATIIYVVLALGALMALPKDEIIQNQEFALAAGAEKVLGFAGRLLVVGGAVLATASAISGTLFGASRLLAVIARDGNFPRSFAQRKRGGIPSRAIVLMATVAFAMVVLGGLEELLEFGSITFMIASFMMALANLKMRHETKTPLFLAMLALIALSGAVVAVLVYQATVNPQALFVTIGIYLMLGLGAVFSTRGPAKPGV